MIESSSIRFAALFYTIGGSSPRAIMFGGKNWLFDSPSVSLISFLDLISQSLLELVEKEQTVGELVGYLPLGG